MYIPLWIIKRDALFWRVPILNPWNNIYHNSIVHLQYEFSMHNNFQYFTKLENLNCTKCIQHTCEPLTWIIIEMGQPFYHPGLTFNQFRQWTNFVQRLNPSLNSQVSRVFEEDSLNSTKCHIVLVHLSWILIWILFVALLNLKFTLHLETTLGISNF